jgi:4-amino-4-deoxy-L-arabinose transferase-like glycosyltransferase
MSGPPLTDTRNEWRLSLVIPSYNEAAGIRQAIAEADAALARLTVDYEILIVDDGSSDATAQIVNEESSHRPHLRLLQHSCNVGYGAALRTGFTAARFERVAFTDADCQFHLDDLAGLLCLAEHAPVAVGYRIDRQDPARRRFLSWGYNTLVRGLLGTRVRDCDCALKVFHRRALASLLPETNRFFVNTEMLTRARQLGYEVAEIGVRHRPRLRGMSTVAWSDVPRTLAALLPFWWSRVLFPGSRDGTAPKRATSAVGLFDWGLLALVVAAALLFFTKLSCPLQEPQEARYAEIPRQMLQERSWLVPVLDGQPYCDKPPLLYWLVMAAYQVLGVHDWAARLVPSIAGFLTVLVTYFWGKRTVGRRAAFAGAAILCLSCRFIYYGRMVTMDPLLTLWVTTALATAHLALTRQERLNSHALPPLAWSWWVISAIACALGILTKGPVALALTAVPVLTVQLLDPRLSRPHWSAWSVYAVALAVVALPWFAAIAMQQEEFTAYFFWRHNLLRFVAPFDHEGPPWYYLPGLLLGLLPWTLLLPGLARFLCQRSARTARRRPEALGFFLVAFLWCFLFFSAAGCKRPAYILPAIPPIALALGCYLNAIVPERRWRTNVGVLFTRLSVLPLCATALVLILGAAIAIAAVGTEVVKPARGLALFGTALVVGALIAWQAKRLRPSQAWWLCGTVTFLALYVGVWQILPANARRFSLRGQVRALQQESAYTPLTVACYPHGWDSIGFYMPSHSVHVYGADERPRLFADLGNQAVTLLVVKAGDDMKAILKEMPIWMEFVPQGRRGLWVVGQVRPRVNPPDPSYARR